VSDNPTAEKMASFHPDAPGRAVEKYFDGPCKMKPPQGPAAGLIGEFWPFPWGANASPPHRAGCMRMNFLRPVGRMKMGNLCLGRQEKINLVKIG
jgi:hypothetical protein